MVHSAIGIALLISTALLLNHAAGSWVPARGARIVGGSEAARNQFPYQVVLFMNNGQMEIVCGGSFISNWYVMTAAHCTVGIISGEVWGGVLNINTDDPVYYADIVRSNFVVHNAYNPTTQANDIALIRLPTIVNFNTALQPLALPTRTQANNLFVGSLGLVAGFGRFQDSSQNISPQMRYVQLPILANSECSRVYGNVVLATSLCVSGANGKSSCEGDSGGALTVTLNNRQVQVGIVSFGTTTCANNYPVVYTRVTSYLDWIQQNSNVVIVQ